MLKITFYNPRTNIVLFVNKRNYQDAHTAVQMMRWLGWMALDIIEIPGPYTQVMPHLKRMPATKNFLDKYYNEILNSPPIFL